MKKIKIVGQRGSWFAHAGEDRMPIMWADEIHKQTLCTDWVENAREHTANKRKELIEYFSNSTEDKTRIVVAQAVDTEVRPRAIKQYVAVFEVKVVSVDPEIELKILKRIADAK